MSDAIRSILSNFTLRFMVLGLLKPKWFFDSADRDYFAGFAAPVCRNTRNALA